jgi:hypothetical protein
MRTDAPATPTITLQSTTATPPLRLRLRHSMAAVIAQYIQDLAQPADPAPCTAC